MVSTTLLVYVSAGEIVSPEEGCLFIQATNKRESANKKKKTNFILVKK
jgi:hypothetical protein